MLNLKDEEYDFFYDPELDDGLYDLTVDFEAELGFRVKRKSDKDASKKHHKTYEGQTSSVVSSTDDEKISRETNYEDSDT